jgi:hypothetical protein
MMEAYLAGSKDKEEPEEQDKEDDEETVENDARIRE